MSGVVAAAILALSACVSWFVAAGARPAARVYLRFALVLLAALPVAAVVAPSSGPAITLLVLPLATTILALATATGFARAPEVGIAAALLAAVSLLALAAALTGLAAPSLAPTLAAAVAMGILCVKHRSGTPALQGLAAGFAFLGAASAFALDATGSAVQLFLAAGLLGVTLALSRSDSRVEQQARREAGTAIGGLSKG